MNFNNAPLNYINMDYSKNIENMRFFELLKNFLIFEKKIEEIREEIFSLTDYNIYSLFNFFDTNNTGQIVKSEWRRPLSNIGIKVDDEDLFLMLDRFSRDGNYAIK
jgi:Ca2+-binding EF-hand superfamily protein